MDNRNSAKVWRIENKAVGYQPIASGRATKRGPQNEGKSHDLVENTCRKNVSSEICHDFYENTRLTSFCHDVDEKKGSY
jgi:hypothetical protein